jgi:hypothetical protein
VTEWELEDLGKFVKKLRPSDEIVVEITGNTRVFFDVVVPHVVRVVVVNTSQFKVIRQSVKKTDPHDARALMLYLSKNMLPEGRMKDKEHGQLASLTQTRDTLMKLSDVSDSIARGPISEIHGCRSFRPTTASASRPGASSGSVNRYSAEFESVQPGTLSTVVVQTRGRVDLEELDEVLFRHRGRGHGEHCIHQRIFGKSRLPIVHQQESDGGVRRHALVAVDERVVAADMEQVGSGHGGDGGVQELFPEAGLRLGDSRFEKRKIPDAGGAAIAFDLLAVDLQHLLKR